MINIVLLFQRILSFSHRQKSEIPIYPPPPPIYLIEDSKTLFRKHRNKIEELVEELALDRRTNRRYLLPVIERLLEYAQNLPASERNHHRFSGGFIDHSLDVAIRAVRTINADKELMNSIAYERGFSEQNKNIEVSARVAIAAGGLLHDIGKLETDYRVCILGNGPNSRGSWVSSEAPWHPEERSLFSWAKENNVSRVVVDWHIGRGKKHERFGGSIAKEVLAETLGWLARENLHSFKLLQRFLVNQSVDTCFSSLIKKLDSNSTKEWLAEYSVAKSPRELGLEQAILNLLETNELWIPNRSGGRVFRSQDGHFIYWKAAIDEIFKELNRLKVEGLPRDYLNLAEILVNTGFAVEPSVNSYGPLWKLSFSSTGGKEGDCYMLKLSDEIVVTLNEQNSGSELNNSTSLPVEAADKKHVSISLEPKINVEKSELIEDRIETELRRVISLQLSALKPVSDGVFELKVEDIAGEMKNVSGEALWKMVLAGISGVEIQGDKLIVLHRDVLRNDQRC